MCHVRPILYSLAILVFAPGAPKILVKIALLRFSAYNSLS